jgi:hypothetical protein
MRSLPVVVAAALALSACGSGTEPSPADVFPVTLLRKGGVAGFDDRIVVTQEGRATASGRGAGSACTLEEPALRDLTALASRVEGTAETTYEVPDDLVLVLQTPTGSSRLGDLDQPDRAAVVTGLFEELFSGEAAERSLCR